jgi:hypothetical protein
LEEDTPASGREGDETSDGEFNEARMAVRSLNSIYSTKKSVARLCGRFGFGVGEPEVRGHGPLG